MFIEDCTCPESIFFLVERVPVEATTLADSREACQILNAFETAFSDKMAVRRAFDTAVQSCELRSEYCISRRTGRVLDELEIA